MTNGQVLYVIVIVTLAFEFTNGWHDAASSIATIVSTRVLRPLWAVAWAAFSNFLAAFVFGTAVAKTMGSGLVNLKMVDETVLLAGLLGAIVWNYATIRMGLPASSSHALIGGYGGAAVAAAGFRAILIHGWILPIIFIFLGPLIGMAAGLIMTVITSWIVRRQSPHRVDKWFRRLQLISAGAFSLGHGTNDAQKGMGIITAALVSSGALPTYVVPYWVIVCCHLAIAGGTMAGGWRVVKTLRHCVLLVQVREIFRWKKDCRRAAQHVLALIPAKTEQRVGWPPFAGASRALGCLQFASQFPSLEDSENCSKQPQPAAQFPLAASPYRSSHRGRPAIPVDHFYPMKSSLLTSLPPVVKTGLDWGAR